MLEHLSVLCEADWYIANGATQKDMQNFYASISYKTMNEMSLGLQQHFQQVKRNCEKLSNEDWLKPATSYWGVTYTKYEWLLETLAHFYHHRGQLHAMLVHCCGKDLKVPMFE